MTPHGTMRRLIAGDAFGMWGFQEWRGPESGKEFVAVGCENQGQALIAQRLIVTSMPVPPRWKGSGTSPKGAGAPLHPHFSPRQCVRALLQILIRSQRSDCSV